MKIRPMGSEFRADGQRDMTKPIVALRNFAIKTKKRNPAAVCTIKWQTFTCMYKLLLADWSWGVVCCCYVV